ncbi:MAG: hypothetical protein ABSE50_08615, partial [Xanthobacteraceae bacterium]
AGTTTTAPASAGSRASGCTSAAATCCSATRTSGEAGRLSSGQKTDARRLQIAQAAASNYGPGAPESVAGP